jgi:hypothetical protein
VNADGTFVIDSVIPGSYNLMAVQQGQGQVYSTRMRLEVGVADVTGINLAVRPGVDVRGRSTSKSGAAISNGRLRSLASQMTSCSSVTRTRRCRLVGKFTLTNVPQCRIARLAGLPNGAYDRGQARQC